MKKYLKYLPMFFLFAAPYVLLFVMVVVCWVENGLTATALGIILISFVVIILLIYIPNTIYAVILLIKKEESQNILLWNFILKMFHIPFYIFMFILGLLFSIMLLFTIPLVIIIIVMDYTLFWATSLYGIVGIIQAKREKI